MKEELVVLEVFSNRMEAEIVKGLLETYGIATYIFSPDGTEVSIPTPPTILPVRLMVNSSDLQEAQELLMREKK